MAAGKERILRLREQVEALQAQLVDARSSLATYKVCGEDIDHCLGGTQSRATAQTWHHPLQSHSTELFRA